MNDDDDDELTPEEILAEIEAGPPPPTMAKLGTTKDWILTVWCDDCDCEHHFLAKSTGKMFDVYECNTEKQKKSKDGRMIYVGRFKTIDAAADKIEEDLQGGDDDDGV
jgi:hypothetical protein